MNHNTLSVLLTKFTDEKMQQVYSGGLVESVQGGGDRPRQLLCEARPDPDGEVHEPGGRLQLLHQRGVASPRGRASLPGGKKSKWQSKVIFTSLYQGDHVSMVVILPPFLDDGLQVPFSEI